MARFSKTRVCWMGMNIWPTYVGFCPSERAYDAFLKEFKIKDPTGYPKSAGNTTVYEISGGRTVVLVFIADYVDNKVRRDKMGVVALLAHEAVHAKQFIFKDMGVKTKKLDHEFEAYTVHHILGHMMKAYHETRKGLG